MADDKRKSIPPSLDQEIGKFDSTKLNKTEVVEKNSLPSVEAIAQEKTIQNIEAFDKGQLRPTKTEEKNPLPDAATIDQEKKGKWWMSTVTRATNELPLCIFDVDGATHLNFVTVVCTAITTGALYCVLYFCA